MRKIMLSIFVLVLAVLTFAHLAAADEMKAKANLTGAAEVPGPGDPDGGGTVQVTLNTDKNEVCYDLTVTRLMRPRQRISTKVPSAKMVRLKWVWIRPRAAPQRAARLPMPPW